MVLTGALLALLKCAASELLLTYAPNAILRLVKFDEKLKASIELMCNLSRFVWSHILGTAHEDTHTYELTRHERHTFIAHQH